MYKTVFIKIFALGIFVLAYFQLVIPLRESLMSRTKSQMNAAMIDDIRVFEEGKRGLSVYELDGEKKYKTRVSFGMNFFIGFIGLILISASKKFYLIEIGVQILFGLIIYFSFINGVKGNVFFLKISDMASIYFLPLSSLFMVVLAFIEKKTAKEKLSHES